MVADDEICVKGVISLLAGTDLQLRALYGERAGTFCRMRGVFQGQAPFIVEKIRYYDQREFTGLADLG